MSISIKEQERREKIRQAKLGKSTKGYNYPNRKKENHPNWKGGYHSKGIPSYDTYAHRISYAEQVRRNEEDKNILEVRCAYCNKWYIPTLKSVRNRIDALKGSSTGEKRLYCSMSCKRECPIYYQMKFPKGHKKESSREVQPELRQIVFERDNWECKKCGSVESLHCHHIEGIELNPIESADIDNCITLCKECHKEIHSQEGCKRSDYRKKKCKEIY
jgi:hypothetical protein